MRPRTTVRSSSCSRYCFNSPPRVSPLTASKNAAMNASSNAESGAGAGQPPGAGIVEIARSSRSRRSSTPRQSSAAAAPSCVFGKISRTRVRPSRSHRRTAPASLGGDQPRRSLAVAHRSAPADRPLPASGSSHCHQSVTGYGLVFKRREETSRMPQSCSFETSAGHALGSSVTAVNPPKALGRPAAGRGNDKAGTVTGHAVQSLADEKAPKVHRLLLQKRLLGRGGQHQCHAREVVEKVFLQQRDDLPCAKASCTSARVVARIRYAWPMRWLRSSRYSSRSLIRRSKPAEVKIPSTLAGSVV